MKNNKQNKLSFFTIVNHGLSLLLLLSVLLCGQVIWQVSQNGYVSFLDKSIFRVVTGSMEPTLPIGTILLSQETDISQIQEGDIVCFRSLSDYLDGAIITHRVISIDIDDTGEIELYTQGDANTVSDGHTVTEDNLIGKVVWNSKEDSILSTILGGLTDPMGMIAIVIVPCMIISSLIMGDAVKSIRKELLLLKEAEAERSQTAPEEGCVESYEEMEQRILAELKQELQESLLENRAESHVETVEEMEQRILGELKQELQQEN